MKDIEMKSDSANTFVMQGLVNTGKTTIFNSLCSKQSEEGNYPGTTVEISSGRINGEKYRIIDIPGVNTILGSSQDDAIAGNILFDKEAGQIINVLDAKNLKQSLAMSLFLSEFQLPMVLNINMVDEAVIRGITIDTDKLWEIFEVPVNKSVAIEGEGLSSLKNKLVEAKVPKRMVEYPKYIKEPLELIEKLLDDKIQGSRALGILLFAGNRSTEKFVEEKYGRSVLEKINLIIRSVSEKAGKPLSVIFLELYLKKAEEISLDVQQVSQPVKMPFLEKLGMWSRNVSTGVPIAILIMVMMFYFVGKFGAEYLVGIFEGTLFNDNIVPWVAKLFETFNVDLLTDLMVGQFGLINVGLKLAIGVVAPVIFTFFIFFGFLEHSGYLPRVSVLLDKVFKKIGLSGKGVLPIIMGFSCITMAILTTRMLDSKKEKTIATLLLVLGLPCAPLLSVMLIIFSKLQWYTYFVVFGILFFQMLLVGFIAHKLIPDKRSVFLMSVPPLRIPKIKHIFTRAWSRTWNFLKEAIPLFLVATFFLFILDSIGTLDFIKRISEPFINGFVGLPTEAVEVFVSTFIRREAGAAVLYEHFEAGTFDSVQTVVCLLIMTFLSPCVNAILVIIKEHGLKTMLAILGFVVPYSLLMGAFINYIFRTFNITF